jgi:hypothetical protein
MLAGVQHSAVRTQPRRERAGRECTLKLKALCRLVKTGHERLLLIAVFGFSGVKTS